MGVYEVLDPDGVFGRSVSGFTAVLAELASPLADAVTHAELEDWLQQAGRELMRSLLRGGLMSPLPVRCGSARGWSLVMTGR